MFSDNDWAGCRETRKSTIGGAIKYGSHTIKTWSKTLASIMLSSAEAELHGLVKSSAEAIGVRHLLRDLEFKPKLKYMGMPVPHLASWREKA